MMKQAVVGIVILVAGVLPAFGQDFPADLSPSEKLYGLSLFWKEVSYNFAYFDQVPELDWDKVYREYLPKVLETRSTFEYYRTLQRFCALLKDGHTNVSIPRAMWDEYMDRPPVAVAQIQGKPVIVNLAQSLAPEVPLGSEILRIDGTPARQYLEKEVIPYISSSTEHIRWNDAIFRILDGPKGSRVKMEFRTPGGEVGTVTVVRNARQSTEEWVKQRNLTRPLTKFRWMEDGIAYVALNSFNNSKIVDEFDALLPEVRKAKAVILDLRGNPGGSTENGTAILDHFTDRPLAGSAWRTREHRAANKAWGKFDMDRGDSESLNARYFRGVVWYSSFHDTLYPTNEPKILVPVAVLIGSRTASAAEDFLIYADKVPHFTKVGTPTYGSTGQPLMMDLPGGGSARICTKRDTYPDGRDFVGIGVLPDVEVEETLGDFLQARDAALDKAVSILKGKLE